MRSLFTALILASSVVGLAGCDNGNNDSTSGGGSALSLNGTWFVNPDVRPKNERNPQSYFATLTQTGNAVSSTAIAYAPEQPNSSCDKGIKSSLLTGTVAGNTFTGSIKTFADVPVDPDAPEGDATTVDYSLATFTVTGTSNSLAGSYRITYYSGACFGARTGTVTMRRN
jgi:hypothetical protein